MKAVILAAGIGSRLSPLTDEMPKCMIEVNGIKIIERQIENLISNNIKDIVVITGYKSGMLQTYLKQTYPSVSCIENKRYLETNNMFSLFLAYDYLKGSDFLLMNADVYFDSNIITGILQQKDGNIIACDTSQYIEESMKVTMSGSINHISKKISESEYYAVSIDIYKLSEHAANTLFEVINDIITVQKNENSWTEVALDNIFNKEKFMPYIIHGRWFEIDNHEDLAKARIIFANDTICN
jgi:L-glutamine-phosphate cytidylyltransferase